MRHQRCLLVMTSLLFLPAVVPAEPAGQREIQIAYGELAAAMERRDLPAFMALFAPEFSRKGEQREAVSREQWEAFWKKNFQGMRTLGPVTFETEQSTADGDKVVVTARRTLFFVVSSGEEFFDDSRSRDTWVRVGAGWRLQHQEAVGFSVEGNVQPEQEALDSPRLVALLKDLKAGRREVLERFWKELAGKAPLVEPIPSDDKALSVTFIWRGVPGTQNVELQGSLPSQGAKTLSRLADTDLWYRTERLPADSRFVYSFRVTKPMTRPKFGETPPRTVTVAASYPDPFNPRSFNGGPVVELPGAPPQLWRERQANVPAGALREHTIRSKVLDEQRRVTVYSPAGYQTNGRRYGLLVLFDGEDYRNLIPAPVILDNLIAKGKVVPLIAVLVDKQTSRRRDLHCSAPFADFLATELVPWVRDHYHVDSDPKQTIVGGLSLGGLMAAYCGFCHPEVFGNVLSQSGAFWRSGPGESAAEDGWLPRQFAKGDKLPLRFYLEVGRFDSAALLASNRRLRDVLEAKGYSITYAEFNGGHDYLSWRGSLADGLIALMGGKPREPGSKPD